MNLKEVAGRLDVHYQTVYRWVRSGELAAVRYGARYEVSEAALNRFLAVRSAVAPESHERRRAPDLSSADALEELEALAQEPVLTVSAVVAVAARRGASVLGDLCVVEHADSRGRRDALAVEHEEVTRLAFAVADLEDLGRARGVLAPMSAPAHRERRVVREPHVAQDAFARQLRPELRQYWPEHSVHSLLSVPVLQAGNVIGAVTFTRDRPDAPYTEEDESFAVAFATRVGDLFATAEEISLAWRARASLVESISGLAAFGWAEDAEFRAELQRMIDSCVGADQLPIVLIDHEGRFLAANGPFEIETGHRVDSVVGRLAAELTGPEDVERDTDNLQRVARGELDHLDVLATRILRDGRRRVYASHRAAVRSVEGQFLCSIGVWRPLHLPSEDHELLLRTADLRYS